MKYSVYIYSYCTIFGMKSIKLQSTIHKKQQQRSIINKNYTHWIEISKLKMNVPTNDQSPEQNKKQNDLSDVYDKRTFVIVIKLLIKILYMACTGHTQFLILLLYIEVGKLVIITKVIKIAFIKMIELGSIVLAQLRNPQLKLGTSELKNVLVLCFLFTYVNKNL